MTSATEPVNLDMVDKLTLASLVVKVKQAARDALRAELAPVAQRYWAGYSAHVYRDGIRVVLDESVGLDILSEGSEGVDECNPDEQYGCCGYCGECGEHHWDGRDAVREYRGGGMRCTECEHDCDES